MVLQRGARRVLPLVAIRYSMRVWSVLCSSRLPEALESEGRSCLVGLYRGFVVCREDETPLKIIQPGFIY